MTTLDPITAFDDLIDLSGEPSDSLLTPFEAWCEAHSIDPDAPLAWGYYRRSLDKPPTR
ncbi:hypothetical protein [Nocardioides ferulae]|uniref:hypothetical protein n=1 Tax=Nocardioides ferulae TaxID=2340821 RepID=UPI0013DE1C82|nr:hypothetical protein [Nocardioides ferulae]